MDDRVKRIPISSDGIDRNDNETRPLLEDVQVTSDEKNKVSKGFLEPGMFFRRSDNNSVHICVGGSFKSRCRRFCQKCKTQ